MTNKITSMLSRLAAPFLKPTLALLAACIVGIFTGSAKGELLITSYKQNFEDEVDLGSLFGDTFAAYGNQIFGTTEGVGTESTGLNDAGSVSVVQYTPYEASAQTSIAQLTCMKKRAKVFGRIFPIPETAFTGASEYTVEFDYFPGAITGSGQTGLAIQGENGVLATLNMGAGQKNGSSGGNRPPEFKQGEYETIYDPEKAETASRDVMTEQNSLGKDSVQIETGPGKGTLEGDVPFRQVVGEYAEQEAKAAESAHLTKEQKDWVDEYFRRLTDDQ